MRSKHYWRSQGAYLKREERICKMEVHLYVLVDKSVWHLCKVYAMILVEGIKVDILYLSE